MIELKNLKNSEASGLFLQNNNLKITKTIEDIIVLDNNYNIEVLDNIKVRFLDCAVKKSLTVNIGKNAVVNYEIISSSNTKRLFNNQGMLDVTEICLDATNEDLLINNLEETSSSKVEVLAIGNGFNQTFTQRVNHKALNTESNISNFGVAMAKAEILFDTTGKIEKGMAKSICRQLSKGIIMDDDSKVTSKPILLIDEYDVVANHGASIGKMSDESLFYLMSRGLSRFEAFLLILEGIIRPFINKVSVDKLKEDIDKKLMSLIKR